MTFQSTSFDMSSVMNKLRNIAEQSSEQLDELAPNDQDDGAGKEIDQGSFTRTMSRLQAIKDAVGEDDFNALKSGVRALYMNRRPNLQQMTALMDLLETMLAYVAEDNSLFQRLKADLSKDVAGGQQPNQAASAAPEVGAPGTAEPEMRGMKA